MSLGEFIKRLPLCSKAVQKRFTRTLDHVACSVVEGLLEQLGNVLQENKELREREFFPMGKFGSDGSCDCTFDHHVIAGIPEPASSEDTSSGKQRTLT